MQHYRSGNKDVTHEFTQRWHLQSQIDDRDWKTHINAATPMSVDDPEPQRWRAMSMFEGHRWRVIHITVSTQTTTEIVREKENA